MEAVQRGIWSFKAPIWKNVSAEAKDFVTRLLTVDQDKRPTAAEILKHSWIQKHIEVQVTKEQALEALTRMSKF